MGCCFCRPTAEVTEDPDVAMHTAVSSCVMLPHHGGYVMYSGLFDGLFYVRGDQLSYETKVGSRFWCKCGGLNWTLSDIKQIDVVTGNVGLCSRRGFIRTLTMSPGLMILFTDNTRMVTAMPDAANFCARLQQYITTTGIVQNTHKKSVNRMALVPMHPLVEAIPNLTIQHPTSPAT